LGRNAQIIGEVKDTSKGKVILKTPYGVERVLEPPSGEILPRLC